LLTVVVQNGTCPACREPISGSGEQSDHPAPAAGARAPTPDETATLTDWWATLDDCRPKPVVWRII